MVFTNTLPLVQCATIITFVSISLLPKQSWYVCGTLIPSIGYFILSVALIFILLRGFRKKSNQVNMKQLENLFLPLHMQDQYNLNNNQV